MLLKPSKRLELVFGLQNWIKIILPKDTLILDKCHFDTAKDSKEKAKNITFMQLCLCDVTDSQIPQIWDFTFHKTQKI